MQHSAKRIIVALSICFVLAASVAHGKHGGNNEGNIDVGSRPALLVDGMDPGMLKDRLDKCRTDSFTRTDFSIGHRGAALRFPEHTRESYVAAAHQGAGIVECDVTFTSDRELVCRHSQCDLHTTTNILAIPGLAARCSIPFSPYDAATGSSATARCCTSDLTLGEFRKLKGKMDGSNPRATTVAEYLDATADWRTDHYAGHGTLMTHAESIELFKELGVKMTPELKAPSVPMPWQGSYTQQDYAQQMIDEYKQAGVKAKDVWAQSFNLEDVKYWIDNESRFGKQAVYLDSRMYKDAWFTPSLADFNRLKAMGVEIVAPPMFALLELDTRGDIVPSEYARLARAAGLGIITWTLERSDLRHGAIDANGNATFYYSSIAAAVTRDSDMYKVLDVLAQEVKIDGIFSDWPATVTYYANCMGLK